MVELDCNTCKPALEKSKGKVVGATLLWPTHFVGVIGPLLLDPNPVLTSASRLLRGQQSLLEIRLTRPLWSRTRNRLKPHLGRKVFGVAT